MSNKQRIPLPDLQLLEELASPALRKLYRQQFEQAPPKHASANFLRYNLAWVKQAIDQGHEPMALRESLIKQLQTALGVASCKPQLPSGTRLIREWQGMVYEINVTERGYVWEGRTYKSLSPIATEITGTRWSGPRFFGLKGQAIASYSSSGASS